MTTLNSTMTRADRMSVLSDLAKTSPALVQELVKTYAVNEIVTLAAYAFEESRPGSYQEVFSSVAEVLRKAVGLELTDVDTPVTLEASESDAWDQVAAQA